MKSNGSTYRFQFHKDFTLQQAIKLVPYLKQLGIETLYASPVFKAVPGSTHGYDTLDPLTINPEIGTLGDYELLSSTCKKAGLGLMQDIVPNHMAFDSRNPWLCDVLEKGKSSIYYHFFDIFFPPLDSSAQLMLPFLGRPLKEVLKQNELSIQTSGAGFFLKYFDSLWPINEQGKTLIKDRLNGSASNNEALERLPSSFVEEVVSVQFYLPCYWKETNEHINFRRFFTVNGLLCLNMQHKQLFDEFHTLIGSFSSRGIVSALRVDHADGLYDPEEYLRRLRGLAGDLPIYVEKILAQEEFLPNSWPVQGTTGYDFLAKINNLFTYPSAKADFYRIASENAESSALLHESKASILFVNMGGELENLTSLLKTVPNQSLQAFSHEQLKQALAEVMIAMPVYRLYSEGKGSAAASKVLAKVVQEAAMARPELTEVCKLIGLVLTAGAKGDENEGGANNGEHRFFKRFMQFSGPLMAKGVEDTLMYNFGAFAAHNEVGDSPFAFGVSTDDFHSWVIKRLREHPLDMNATSTHDTKRGEDVRARLNVLSETPERWERAVAEWRTINLPLREAALSESTEYFIYQNLFGSLPYNHEDDPSFAQRFIEYLQKALREGKRYSSWEEPNVEVEEASGRFINALLDKQGRFYASLTALTVETESYAVINSLSQVTLKCTLPGVPDIYQGCDLWDLSLVDPDNRRPVNYELRQHLSLSRSSVLPGKESQALAHRLWSERSSGEIKQHVTQTFLNLRKAHSGFFSGASYLPLTCEGPLKEHIFAFLRTWKQEAMLVVVPLFSSLLGFENGRVASAPWKDTRVLVPSIISAKFTDALTGEQHEVKQALHCNQLFKEYPVAVLFVQEQPNIRAAGVLLHITSLPSSTGSGNLGKEAFRFVDFLAKGKQKIWQVLPVGPVGKSTGYSPYSSFSSFAGNTQLISLELLRDEGLLDAEQLQKKSVVLTNTEKARQYKIYLLDEAYAASKKLDNSEFEDFCSKKSSWLEEFSLFTIIKSLQKGLPWYDWPAQLRLRNKEALQGVWNAHSDAIRSVKWRQFIFFKQWHSLKSYANSLNVQLYGDLPFYSAYDSCDVWANQSEFALDAHGKLLGQAGVPPDYFNEDGQLWGMPVYNWQQAVSSNFKWWLSRIDGSIDLFNKIRIDHFRAFYDYWEVPANDATARFGQWRLAPGDLLLEAVKKNFVDFPFFAEDLGEINPQVFALRDKYALQGMKILQYAFDDKNFHSPDLPNHYGRNFIAYTGTHDNNTTLGWFKNELTKESRQRLFAYLGRSLRSSEIADVLIRLAHGSVADTAIIPMQDVLGLGADARMNVPSTPLANWSWQLGPVRSWERVASRLATLVNTYHR